MTARTDLTRPTGARESSIVVGPGLWTVLAGVAMVVFLGLRPWGDKTGDSLSAVEAFASFWWPAAHAVGAGVFVFLALRAMAVAHRRPGDRAAAVGAVSTGIGAVGVVLYYGMEALALHGLALPEAGRDPVAVLATAEALRTGTFAMTLFGAGLLLVTVGVALSCTAGPVRGAGWGHWVLVLAVAAILPHFFLPPVGRMVFGVLFLVACLLEVTTDRTHNPGKPASP